jgi:hypothetical protein
MTKHRNAVDAEIANRLAAAPAPGSPNRLSAQQIKEWAVEYLRDYDDELTRFPELVGQAHWNLWMMDARSEEALFAVLIFRADEVEFFCGTGIAFEVKSFAESDFPDNLDEVFEMMKGSFSIRGGSVRFERQAAEKWLGRSW